MVKRTISAHARLVELQRRVYRALQREAAALFGRTPEPIRRYEAACRQDFNGRHHVSTKSELIAAIRSSDVTFVADYHAYGQAQRTALRLLREAVLPGERWVVGLELIPSQFQHVLDDYQAGRIGVERFHEAIRYREEWGFPWKNYEPIFEWARRHGIPLVALNRPKELIYRPLSPGRPLERSLKDLHLRDEWAAGIITDCFHDSPDPMRMLVLYGGYHVGRAHLPAKLERISRAFLGRPLRSVSVHQNVDHLYWKLAQQERELHAQVLRFNRSTYCVFSGTPWAQLQSLIGTVEGERLESATYDEDEEPVSQAEDHLSLMSRYARVVAEFFGLEPPSFESLTLHTIEEADFVDTLRDAFRPGSLRLIRRLVNDGHRIYLPEAQVAYLATPSPNSAAEMAAIHLLARRTRPVGFFEGGREDFFRLALESAFGFLGSLIINPRRKCDLVADHARRLRVLGRGEPEAFVDDARARRLALAVLRGKGAARERALRDLPQRPCVDAAYALIAARYVGQSVAMALYPVVLRQDHGEKRFRETAALFLRRRDFEAAFGALLDPSREGAAKAVLLSKTELL